MPLGGLVRSPVTTAVHATKQRPFAVAQSHPPTTSSDLTASTTVNRRPQTAARISPLVPLCTVSCQLLSPASRRDAPLWICKHTSPSLLRHPPCFHSRSFLSTPPFSPFLSPPLLPSRPLEAFLANASAICPWRRPIWTLRVLLFFCRCYVCVRSFHSRTVLSAPLYRIQCPLFSFRLRGRSTVAFEWRRVPINWRRPPRARRAAFGLAFPSVSSEDFWIAEGRLLSASPTVLPLLAPFFAPPPSCPSRCHSSPPVLVGAACVTLRLLSESLPLYFHLWQSSGFYVSPPSLFRHRSLRPPPPSLMRFGENEE